MFSKYEYVYAVYKEQSFTNAAKKLFISQPSLSAAIKNIESSIGAPIFERTGSGIKLTQLGKEYVDSTEKIIRIKNEFLNKMNDIYNLEIGHIKIGGTNYLSSYVLPKIINRFTSQYPKIEITLVEGNSKNLSNMIEKEEIDIVIDSFDEAMDKYNGYPLVRERILLCVPANWKINEKLKQFQISPDSIYNGTVKLDEIPSVSIDIFKDQKFILLKSGNDMYNRAMKIFNKSNIKPIVAYSVDQLNISYALVDSGMGICFATDTLFKYGHFNQNVLLYNVGEEHCSRTLYIAYKRNKYCSNAMSEFINIAKEVIK